MNDKEYLTYLKKKNLLEISNQRLRTKVLKESEAFNNPELLQADLPITFSDSANAFDLAGMPINPTDYRSQFLTILASSNYIPNPTIRDQISGQLDDNQVKVLVDNQLELEQLLSKYRNQPNLRLQSFVNLLISLANRLLSLEAPYVNQKRKEMQKQKSARRTSMGATNLYQVGDEPTNAVDETLPKEDPTPQPTGLEEEASGLAEQILELKSQLKNQLKSVLKKLPVSSTELRQIQTSTFPNVNLQLVGDLKEMLGFFTALTSFDVNGIKDTLAQDILRILDNTITYRDIQINAESAEAINDPKYIVPIITNFFIKNGFTTASSQQIEEFTNYFLQFSNLDKLETKFATMYQSVKVVNKPTPLYVRLEELDFITAIVYAYMLEQIYGTAKEGSGIKQTKRVKVKKGSGIETDKLPNQQTGNKKPKTKQPSTNTNTNNNNNTDNTNNSNPPKQKEVKLPNNAILIGNKYYIDPAKLQMNQLEVRYIKNKHLSFLKPQFVSPEFTQVINSILTTKSVPEATYSKLENKEKNLLKNLIRMFNLNQVIKLQDDAEFEKEFKLLLGEFLAGNDNVEVKNRLKAYILHAIDIGMLTRHRAYQLLIEMSL